MDDNSSNSNNNNNNNNSNSNMSMREEGDEGDGSRRRRRRLEGDGDLEPMDTDLPSPQARTSADVRSPTHVSMSEMRTATTSNATAGTSSAQAVTTPTSEALLNRYIRQLLYGCHSETCTNPFCASNPVFQLNSAQEISNLASTLAKVGPVHLCPDVSTTSTSSTSAAAVNSSGQQPQQEPSGRAMGSGEKWTISNIDRLIKYHEQNHQNSQLIRIIYTAFSSTRDLINFCELSTAFTATNNAAFNTNSTLSVIAKCKDFYHQISSKCSAPMINSLMTGIACLIDSLKIQGKLNDNDYAAICLIFCNPALLDSNYHATVLIRLFDLIANLQPDQTGLLTVFIIQFFNMTEAGGGPQPKLTTAPADHLTSPPPPVGGKRDLQMIVGIIQHFITMRIYSFSSQLGYNVTPNKDEPIANATKTLAIFYQINEKFKYLSYEEFYNEAINENLEIKDDFPHWKAKEGFSFCNYPFILNPATKSDILKVESMVQMRHELQDAFFRAMFIGVNSPYLVLEIRRGFIIRDALYQLESKRPEDLKKQLKIQFVGEDAVDEGGVQKEFFQLATRDIFSPQYNLFSIVNNFHWFTVHPDPVDSELMEEMRLVGMLLGLAIYNGVILDVRFPVVMYKKIMDCPCDIDDLMQFDPVLAKSLKTLLDYTGDVENDFGRTFQIDIDVYNHRTSVNLKPNGDQIPITSANRQEFVDLYIDYIFNKSVVKVFSFFKAGFDLVCKNSAITLFRPEEVELLLCGSSNEMDFEGLMGATSYDGGYTSESPVIQYFWKTTLKFDTEQKKRLLFFATGSDRVPIGGLSKMTFCIAKNGPDSDRLPTSHTCFNVLLLPEYSSEEKLKNRLLTAIQNAEGFGLI